VSGPRAGDGEVPGARPPLSARASPAPRGAVGALVRRPHLWSVAVVTAVRLAPRGWWRRWPPVPWPDAEYWRFRMQTAYGGDGDAPPQPEDVVAYLEWCAQRWRRRRRALR